MAAQTLMDFFSGPVMTELAQSQAIKRGLPFVLPEAFRTPSAARPVGTKAKYRRFNGERHIPPIIHQQSTSKTTEVPGSTWVETTAIGSKENMVVDQEMLYAIMSGVPYVAQNAMMEFRKRMDDFNEKFESLKTTVINSMVLTGSIYAGTNTTGTTVGATMQTTSTNATISVLAGGAGPSTFAHTDSWTNTSVAVGDWSTITTDIPASLRAMKSGYIKTNNYMPKTIIYGKNIPSYFALNTAMQAFMSRNPVIGRQFQDTNEMPAGMLDFNWVPGYNAYFQDSADNLISWLGDDNIVILPEVDDNWYEYIEVGTLVPTGIFGVGENVEGFLKNVRPAYGKFAYATAQNMDPIALKVVSGIYCLPIIKSGPIQWIATTK